MAIFNEAYMKFLLERKSSEAKFKKDYNFIPDKDSKDKRSGTIIVASANSAVDTDQKERCKALKDDNLRSSKTYKSKARLLKICQI